jgi:hypothetical protein
MSAPGRPGPAPSIARIGAESTWPHQETTRFLPGAGRNICDSRAIPQNSDTDAGDEVRSLIFDEKEIRRQQTVAHVKSRISGDNSMRESATVETHSLRKGSSCEPARNHGFGK